MNTTSIQAVAGAPAPRSTTPARVVVAWHGLPGYAVRLLDRAIRDRTGCSFSILTTASDDHQRHPVVAQIRGAPVRRIEDVADVGWRALGGERPDVFVFTSWSHPAYLALAAETRRGGGRLVMMMDNILHGRPKQWAGALWFRAVLRRRIDWLWVPGRRGRSFGRFLGMPEDRIVEGLYGADPEIFSVEDGPASREGVLFVGQLIERKGVPALIEAACGDATLRQRLTMIGAGPLHAQAGAAGLDVRPFAPAAELAREYARSSLFILPSALDHWGVVLHEAALAGCLLAATRQCGAATDLISHGRNGYVLRDNSAEEIRRAVAWHDTLDHARVAAGRNLSRRLARAFGPEPFSLAFARFLA